MSLTAILFIIIFIAGCIATFYHPAFGIILYVFEWHNHPPYMWWGESVPDLRYPFLIAILTVISLFLNASKMKRLPSMTFGPIIWLAAFLFWMYIVSFGWPLNSETSIRRCGEFLNYVILFVLMIYTVREKKHYDWLIWTLIICVANMGRIAWERGSDRSLHVMAPSAVEENAISAHVVSAMPFYISKFFTSLKKWHKALLIILTPFLINLLILANSRGAIIAFFVIGVYSLIVFPVREKKKILLAALGGLILLFALANEQFWERQRTTVDHEEDTSAMGRLYLWRGAIDVMNDYPLGVGARGFRILSFEYVPEMVEIKDRGLAYKGTTVHNTFLLAGTDWGYPGLILFLGFLIHIFIVLHQCKLLLKRNPELKTRFYFEVIAMQLALIGMLTAGFFTNRLYAETLYWYGAFAVILKNIIYSELWDLKNA